MKFIDFLKKLFGFVTSADDSFPKVLEKFPLGATPNEPDTRDISYPLAQNTSLAPFAPVYKPKGLITLARLLQGNLGTCVAFALEFYTRAIDIMLGNSTSPYSRRFLYVLTRRFTNQINTDAQSNQGLPQREAAKVLTCEGISKDIGLDDNTLPHSKYVNDFVITDAMRKEANIARTGGFAFPQITQSGLQQAIKDTFVVPLTVAVDWDTFDYNTGTLHAPVSVDGYHEITAWGWENGHFICANWWNGYLDLLIPFNEVEKIVTDAIVFVDIPNDLKERAKQQQYIFLTDLKVGQTSDAVNQLQKRLSQYGLFNHTPLTRYFGPVTKSAVQDYQRLKGIPATGLVGPLTRQALNESAAPGQTKAKLDLWVEIATKIEGARPELKNPGNIRCNAYKHKDAIGVSKNGFCIFPTDAVGYMALRNFFLRACTTGSASYKPDMTLYHFYEVYAPKADNNNPKAYAETVAKHLGISPTVQIKTLV